MLASRIAVRNLSRSRLCRIRATVISTHASSLSMSPTSVHHGQSYRGLGSSSWEKMTDKDGRTFYFNRETRLTQAEPPKDFDNECANKDDALSPQTQETALVPIDFDNCSAVIGGESQVVEVELKEGQKLRAETGCLLFMTNGVEMDTGTGGGMMKGLTRMFTGENFFVSDFSYNLKDGGSGTVCLGTNFPSKIKRMTLAEHGGSLICQKGAFLCGSSSVEINTFFTKTMMAGFFGGEGFILQKLSGDGDAFIKAGGALIERDLAPGEILKSTSGALVAFEEGVDYDIQQMKGVKNVLFGGEGLFITTLTGPGKVWLQGMPFDRMVGEIASRIPGRGGGMFMPMGMGGGGEGGEGGDATVGGGEGDAGDTGAADMEAGGSDGGESGNIFGEDPSSSVSDPSPSEEFAADESTEDSWWSNDNEGNGSGGSDGDNEGGILSSLWGMVSDNSDD